MAVKKKEFEPWDAGTPDQVKDYCRKLIDNIGCKGGFIIGPPEFTKVYGA
jgi:hypothetical protein